MSADPIDFERINEFTGGDPEQFKELTELYISQTNEQMDQLREALTANDIKKVEHVAHKGAGSSATCGMQRIAPLLRELEQMARANQMEGASVVFEKILQEYKLIQDALATHRPS